jgi:hypothetical protein
MLFVQNASQDAKKSQRRVFIISCEANRYSKVVDGYVSIDPLGGWPDVQAILWDPARFFQQIQYSASLTFVFFTSILSLSKFCPENPFLPAGFTCPWSIAHLR